MASSPKAVAADIEAAVAVEPHKTYDTILVLDFGSQYSHLITRRLRELNVYSEMLPCTQKLADLPFSPKGVVLSGGPYSVYEPDAPHVDPALFDTDIPILGICYGMQEIAWHFGKAVLASKEREYGDAKVTISPSVSGSPSALFASLNSPVDVWMSHGDKLSHLPPSFITVATTDNAPFAGIAHESRPIYGLQFHPEVTHTPQGTALLSNFVAVCKASRTWTMSSFVDQEIARIRALVGPRGQVIGAVSGGVDSTVAATLTHRALGARFHAVLVDNGLLRTDEAKTVQERLTEGLGIQLAVVDASERFLSRLAGVAEPEQKRKIIGDQFINEFEAKAKQIAAEARDKAGAAPIEWLLQGTLYPDVIESSAFHGKKGPSATIKTHHNVGGLPARMRLQLLEPLRELFKDEVRALGASLGLAEELVWRHPFPGPGLGIRVLGAVDAEKLRIVREADDIFLGEIRKDGLYRKISQAFAALSGDRAVGVMGDQRVYGRVVILRAVQTTDFMTADAFVFEPAFVRRVSSRIVNEVQGACRVFWDCKLKRVPPCGCPELMTLQTLVNRRERLSWNDRGEWIHLNRYSGTL